ncbi:uncharacterized protein FRV6_15033 [Fusarium oxysporum]|uniref:Uncharacterized protein n=1 Tax=Fusarium oxysporum TaxID=5507 RepID=A0A2H3TTC2_FUSOX|nr:uncharacterized protein FRV6_15033 [Fusarium oxysporum]
MSNETTPRRHKNSPLKRKEVKNDKLVQLVDYINNQILGKGSADSLRNKDHKSLGQSSELTMEMLEILNDIYANPAKVGARDLVDWFMTNGGKEPRRRYQAELVNHFCHSSELQELQSNSSSLSSRRSCLIDDRTSNGIVSATLGQRKPLTSHEMFNRLVEKVDGFEFALASKESQQPLAWLRHARRKLTELVVCLETTIDCWDNFTYPDHMQTRYGRQSMVSIEQTFAEVRNCLKELYNIRTLCDEHERTLNLHNIDEQYLISRMQAQVAESTQVLSCFLLYVVSPITLAAAILSMQEEAIPDFLGPTKLSFFLLTPMLILLVSLVTRLVQHWDKVQLYMSHPGNLVQARKRDVNIGIV